MFNTFNGIIMHRLRLRCQFYSRMFILLFACLFSNPFLFAQPGANDPTFNPSDVGYGAGDGPTNTVRSIVLQSDGKILVGGEFVVYNSTYRYYVARINSDGKLDASFNPGSGGYYIYSMALQSDGKVLIGGYNTFTRLNSNGSPDASFTPGTGPNGIINSVTLQSDGKILIGGSFTSYNGTARNYIARLNSNGSLDASFNPGTGANSRIRSIVIQSDGKILIAGDFTTYNGTARNRIARLNSNGSLDGSFNPGTGANNYVSTMALQTDGKILLAGDFTAYNGTAKSRIARINNNGSIDGTFNPGAGADNYINAVALQSDGKILLGGNFTTYNGTLRNHIARINAGGSLDATFNPGTGANYDVHSLAVQSTGKIFIGGYFRNYNGSGKNCFARINSNGSLDVTFNPGTGADELVFTMALQGDGKIVIGGGFYSYNNTGRGGIARLNSDGTLDAAFNPGTGVDDLVKQVVIQSDGKIVIAGYFISYNGVPRSGIARINSNGSLDAAFNPGTGVDGVNYSAGLQSDGKILIGGDFTNYNGTARNNIARLNSSGTLDATFNPGTGANNTIFSIALQSDGKILTGGNFTSYNGTPRSRIARIHSNGSLDAAFNTGTGANNKIYAMALQNDGKILIGGDFTSYNNTSRNHIARLHSDGSLDASFNPGTGANSHVSSITTQSDGKILIGGSFTSYNGTARNYIARLNSNGTLDATFNPGTGADDVINYVALQSDGKVLIGGDFTSYNGTGRNRIARLFGNITTEQVFYRDADNDGFGNNNIRDTAPTPPTGYVVKGGDCNDANATIYPGATERCDALDNDCDGVIDDGLVLKTFYRDYDKDTYGNSSATVKACAAPPGYVARGGDCNDKNNKVYPTAPELCDGIDNDCDGVIDDGLLLKTFYKDYDKDSYGNNSVTLKACAAPAGYVARGGDCNDSKNSIHPGAAEVVNGVDDDCDGLVDESNRAVSAPGKPVEEAIKATVHLQVEAYPNPSTGYFTIAIQSSSTQPVLVRVLNDLGREVERRNNIAPNSTLHFGHDYRPGAYVMEIVQDNERKAMKLIRQ